MQPEAQGSEGGSRSDLRFSGHLPLGLKAPKPLVFLETIVPENPREHQLSHPAGPAGGMGHCGRAQA